MYISWLMAVQAVCKPKAINCRDGVETFHACTKLLFPCKRLTFFPTLFSEKGSVLHLQGCGYFKYIWVFHNPIQSMFLGSKFYRFQLNLCPSHWSFKDCPLTSPASHGREFLSWTCLASEKVFLFNWLHSWSYLKRLKADNHIWQQAMKPPWCWSSDCNSVLYT